MADCEKCIEDIEVPRAGTYREEYQQVLCDSCCDSQSEAAYERMLSDYYGGSDPVTIAEQSASAAAVKRSQR